jgi:hypothetical protein
VLAGIVIPNSTPCPNDFLVVFLSTPPGGQTQVLPACLGQLPAVPFPAIPPITLSDEAAPGDQGFFELFRLPFLIDYPVAYFVALTTPGAPVSSVLTGAVAVTICVPGSDGLGGAIFNCSS